MFMFYRDFSLAMNIWFKVMEKSWKSPGKNLNHKSLGKVMEICYDHMFIYAEFEIINTFF